MICHCARCGNVHELRNAERAARRLNVKHSTQSSAGSLCRAPQLITERGIENAESQIVCSASSVKRFEKFYYQDRS